MAKNPHDADRFASYFSDDYHSVQPDFRAELLASCHDGDIEWGEVDWRGHHTDGSPFAVRGIIIATIRGDRIAAARLYVEPVEPVEHHGADIDTAVEQLYRPPHQDN